MWHFKGFDFLSVTILPTSNFYKFLQKKYSASHQAEPSLSLRCYRFSSFTKTTAKQTIPSSQSLTVIFLATSRFFIKWQGQCLNWGIIKISAGQKLQELLIVRNTAGEKETCLLEARCHKRFVQVHKSKAGIDLRNVVGEGKVHRTVTPQDSGVFLRAPRGPLLTIWKEQFIKDDSKNSQKTRPTSRHESGFCLL